jgi:cbb3-type cytochrome oxidase subunit 3
MNYKNNKIKKDIKFSSKIINIFAKNLFLIFLLLLLVDSILIGYLFFKYSIQEKEIFLQDYSIGLNQEILNKVSEEWAERESLFQLVNFNQYLDLFRF